MLIGAATAIKAYAVPLLLFSLSLFYQLVVLPRSFPLTHYDVLGVAKYSSIDEVKNAYEKLSSTWNSSVEVPTTVEFLEIRYAYELLSNPLWKRDYDVFGIDEELHVLDKLKEKYAVESISHVDLPLLNPKSSDNVDHGSNVIKTEDFRSMFSDSKPWLIQVYSLGSSHCDHFSKSWKEIASLLDGVANTGIIELGDAQLAMALAERKPTGQFFFRSGIPSLIAFPPECKTPGCVVRYEGDLSVDAITDWFATVVLGLPRVLYYSKETLGKQFLSKSSLHKVKVIFFSKTGVRATPYIRQIAKDYRSYASFAFVLWREEDFTLWWNTFEVESAPAVVFLKDPGVKPIVFHGSFDSSWFSDVMEKNKLQVLPQLRTVTSMELGCDARGHSRAGKDATSWYCVVLAGRLSQELNKMRETLRRVEDLLSNDGASDDVDRDQLSLLATALKNKRLTFAWLDGEAQQKYCFFYLHSETSYDTCGPRRDLADVPRLFVVRYKRNVTQDIVKVNKNILEDDNEDLASQLVARYNGSDEIPQIIKWISETMRDGETRDLPFFKTKTPELVPEDSDPIWSVGAQNVLSRSAGIKQRIQRFKLKIYDHIGDPRIGPVLLLGALMTYATIWLMRSQPSRQSESSQQTQSTEDETTKRRRERRRKTSKRDIPHSVTDQEPKDAYQMPMSDSDSN
ncbi:DNAJ heat shock N-terminal domain-containing protein [Euphorbia peplus]|nr:DNAJ heat shock N-terminal domain-containing protein [Euphorbia peplus]